jgi:hypothetical protein
MADITVEVRPMNMSELTAMSLLRASRPIAVHAYEAEYAGDE